MMNTKVHKGLPNKIRLHHYCVGEEKKNVIEHDNKNWQALKIYQSKLLIADKRFLTAR